ncbi:hypothetical protein [Spirosoma validum]|uniref:Outer membrane protein beta-barrel domain-containing protein n=1 Tax=Spirosoma validum TaxID=2771355 RepID=A0A927GG31_9BACT|nr:hypothetical protein [Spirosoma validum]MBD2756577.1 hypothetical protein [Spirosoma validum]
MHFIYKLAALSLSLIGISKPVNAQLQSQSTAPYVIIKTGYGFPASPQKINEAEVNVGNDTFTSGIYGSYAKGANFSLGIGKMLNSTLGLEINAQYLLGSTIRADYSSDLDSVSGFQTDRIRGLVFTPFVVIRNSGDLLSIYTKLGLAIAAVSSRSEYQESRFMLDGKPYQIVSQASEPSRAKVGFAACFGLSFRVSEKFSLFVEANGQIMSLPISRGNYTKYEVNGVNALPTMTTSDKSWIYEKAGFLETVPEKSSPSTKLYNPAYFSYVGLGIGLTYHL